MHNINVDITLLGYKHLVKNTYNYTMYKKCTPCGPIKPQKLIIGCLSADPSATGIHCVSKYGFPCITKSVVSYTLIVH